MRTAASGRAGLRPTATSESPGHGIRTSSRRQNQTDLSKIFSTSLLILPLPSNLLYAHQGSSATLLKLSTRFHREAVRAPAVAPIVAGRIAPLVAHFAIQRAVDTPGRSAPAPAAMPPGRMRGVPAIRSTAVRIVQVLQHVETEHGIEAVLQAREIRRAPRDRCAARRRWVCAGSDCAAREGAADPSRRRRRARGATSGGRSDCRCRRRFRAPRRPRAGAVCSASQLRYCGVPVRLLSTPRP